MYDAIGKFPISGVTGGNTHSMGSYTSCKDVKYANYTASYDGEFGGKYCLLERTQLRERPVQPSPRQSRIGICVPDVCTDDDIRTAIAAHNDFALGEGSLEDTGYTQFELIECPVNDIPEVPLDGYDYTI